MEHPLAVQEWVKLSNAEQQGLTKTLIESYHHGDGMFETLATLHATMKVNAGTWLAFVI